MAEYIPPLGLQLGQINDTVTIQNDIAVSNWVAGQLLVVLESVVAAIVIAVIGAVVLGAH